MYTKNVAGLVKSYPRKSINNLNADYHAKPQHTVL